MRSSTCRPPICGGAARAGARHPAGCAGHRRERPERPGDVRPAIGGGWGIDAQWADDFHHALRTLVTDERDGYYADFGTVADLAMGFHRLRPRRPFRRSATRVRRARRGPRRRCVRRLLPEPRPGRQPRVRRPHPPAARPLAALCTLLSPYTPMLFMGEEYGEERRSRSSPTTSTRRSPRRPARGGGSSPRSRVRRRSAGPAGPGDVRALEADPARQSDDGDLDANLFRAAAGAARRRGRGRRSLRRGRGLAPGRAGRPHMS